MIILNWEGLFMHIFGTLEGPMGLNIGFWVSMSVVVLVVIIENIVFWSRKPTPEAEAMREAEKRRKNGLWEEDNEN